MTKRQTRRRRLFSKEIRSTLNDIIQEELQDKQMTAQQYAEKLGIQASALSVLKSKKARLDLSDKTISDIIVRGNISTLLLYGNRDRMSGSVKKMINESRGELMDKKPEDVKQGELDLERAKKDPYGTIDQINNEMDAKSHGREISKPGEKPQEPSREPQDEGSIYDLGSITSEAKKELKKLIGMSINTWRQIYGDSISIHVVISSAENIIGSTVNGPVTKVEDKIEVRLKI